MRAQRVWAWVFLAGVWCWGGAAQAQEAPPSDPPAGDPGGQPPTDPPKEEPPKEEPPKADPPKEEPPKEEPPVDPREADMFGGGGEEPGPSPEPMPAKVGGTRDDEALSGGGDTEGALTALLAEQQDPLAIGGSLFLRLNASLLEEGDPARLAAIDPDPERLTWSSPSLLDVYLDARPSDRVRAFTQGRLVYDPTGGGQLAGFVASADPVQAQLDQLWLKFDVERALFVTIGKQRVRWGSGRLWNPTDFLNQQILDPLNATIFDVRLGVNLVKLHLPIESLGWNFYALAQLEQAHTPEQTGGALRVEIPVDPAELFGLDPASTAVDVFGPAEFSFSANARKDNPWRLGADLSWALWYFDLHVEAAFQYGVETSFYRGTLDIPALRFPEEYKRDDEWLVQVVAGGDVQIAYSDQDSAYLGFEYFYNDLGYEGSELYPWLLANNAATFFYLGKHYGALFLLLPAPGDWNDASFTLSGLSNLSDRSVVTRLDVTLRVLTHLRFNVYGAVHAGEQGEFRFGLDIPPVPFDERLADGVYVPPQLFDFGAGLSMDF